MNHSETHSRVIVALDFSDARGALELVEKLDPGLCRLKVGKELFTVAGPGLVEQLVNRGFGVFLDLKYHDIPNTAAAACAAAANLGVWMINVHASGGSRMMSAAREALQKFADPPLLIAVTILTSLSDEELKEIGFADSAAANVVRLAQLAEKSGLDGVVCSAQEASLLRRSLAREFRLVTPGIRPQGSAGDDQRRIMTPAQAVNAGSDYLVIGRPVTGATDPRQLLIDINKEVGSDDGLT